MESVKWMDLREFYKEGYLQEANRQFFHPLGLALAVEMCDDDPEGDREVTIKGLWDYRDDPEGMIFDFGSWQTEEEQDQTRIKAGNVEAQKQKIAQTRKNLVGFDIEPLPELEG